LNMANRIELIVRQGGKTIVSKVLEHGSYIIGKSEADFTLDESEIAPQHARLTFGEDGLFLDDLGGSAGVFLNDERVRERVQLWPAQIARLGRSIEIEVRLISNETDPDGTLPPASAAVRRLLPEAFFQRERYEIGDVVAEGGMGLVFEAREVATGRKVAMKVMRRDGHLGAELSRFVGEAKITARLEHPNIVPVHELGLDERDRVYYTMKFVQGATLADVLGRLARNDPEAVRDYPLAQLIVVLQKVCDAMAFSHSLGVIHRDLKPSNIMLGPFGEVLVMDWGLAKSLSPENAAAEPVTVRATGIGLLASSGGSAEFATGNGALMGTPHFMSPEQAACNSSALDNRADVYALGAILYNLLTLRPPFRGACVDDVLQQVRAGKIQTPVAYGQELAKYKGFNLPHLPGGRVPESLSAVAMRALSMRPEDRYQSVAEFQQEIVAYQSGFATRAEQAGFAKQIVLAVRRHRREAAVFAVCAIALIALAVAAFVKVATERNRANEAFADLQSAAPVYVDQAKALTANERFQEALEKLNYALVLQPNSLAYLTEKADLLESQLRPDEAVDTYKAVLLLGPGNERANDHLRLCQRIARERAAGSISRDALLELLRDMVRERRPLVQILSVTGALGVDRSIGQRLRLASDGYLTLDLSQLSASDLDALAGLPLSDLNLSGCQNVKSLEFLREMPLRSLNLEGTTVDDLAPIAGLSSLTHLNLARAPATDQTPETDLTPLQDLKLKLVNLSGMKVASFEPLANLPIETLRLDKTNVHDLEFLKKMPLRQLTLCGGRELRNIRVLSGLTSLVTICLPEDFYRLPASELRAVDSLRSHPGVNKIAALAVSPKDLESLPDKKAFWETWDRDCHWIHELHARGFSFKLTKLDKETWKLVLKDQPINDLRFLSTAKIRELSLFNTLVADLTPLKDMPLAVLDLRESTIVDISPLKGVPLQELYLWKTKVTDFTVLSEFDKMEVLDVGETPCDSLQFAPLRKLKLLRFGSTQIRDLSPLYRSKIEKIHFDNVPVEDVSPLATCSELKWIVLPEGAQNIETLRNLPKLERISYSFHSESEPAQTASDFWNEFDQPWSEGLRKQRIRYAASLCPDGTWSVEIRNKGFCDLLPFKGTKVSKLTFDGTQVADLSPLMGLPLVSVTATNTQITDLAPLRNCPLKILHIGGTLVADLSPLKHHLLEELSTDRCHRLRDYAPVSEILTLRKLTLTPGVVNIETLRNLPRLKKIDYLGRPDVQGPGQSPDAFWSDFDRAAKRR
jgi:serine/threonine protein kinase